MNPRRAARLRGLAAEIARLKQEHHISSEDLYRYLKFRRLIDRLCDGVRSRSGGKIAIEAAEMEKFYSAVEHSAVRLLRFYCHLLACRLDRPIFLDTGDSEVSFQLDWQTPVESREKLANRVKDPDVPIAFVSPTALIRAIVDAGRIYQPDVLVRCLQGAGWLRLRHRGRTELCTLEAFAAAVLTRSEIIRDDSRVKNTFDWTSEEPELWDELCQKYRREPEPQEVWRDFHRQVISYNQSLLFSDLHEFWRRPSVWVHVTCRHSLLHKRAQLEQTTGQLWVQREILAAYFASLGQRRVNCLLEEARRRLDRSIWKAALYSSLSPPRPKSPGQERDEQLRRWIDEHERWLRRFLVS